MKQGPFAQAGFCCPALANASMTPSDCLSAIHHFPGAPVISGYASHSHRMGPRRLSPVPRTTVRPFRTPYAGGFLGTRSRI
jgi:hypothetical protein